MTVPDVAALATLDRLQAIARVDIFDPVLRRQLDQMCQRTALRLDVPTAMVSFVLNNAQFFAGSHGVTGWIADAQGTPVEWAFCAHAVLSGQPVYVVPDATLDPRHADSPLTTHYGVHAYAGAPLPGRDGHILGMHCVNVPAPRQFSDTDLAWLRHAAGDIVTVLNQHQRCN